MSLPKPYYDQDGITIYNADCRDILPYLPKVDLVLTDPPYGIDIVKTGRVGGAKLANVKQYTASDWDFAPPSEETIEQTVCAGGKAIIWGGNYFNVRPSRCWLVWDKRNSGNFADCELAWTNLNGSVRKIEHLWNGMIRQDNEYRAHPTQKPLKVITWCLSFVPEAETILDPFMGSGTTLVAAKQLGKRAIGIEIDEKYCAIAVERLAQGNLFTETTND